MQQKEIFLLIKSNLKVQCKYSIVNETLIFSLTYNQPSLRDRCKYIEKRLTKYYHISNHFTS